MGMSAAVHITDARGAGLPTTPSAPGSAGGHVCYQKAFPRTNVVAWVVPDVARVWKVGTARGAPWVSHMPPGGAGG